jgi:hypothetical protein
MKRQLGIIRYDCICGDVLADIARMMVKIFKDFNIDCEFVHNERKYFVSKPLTTEEQIGLVLGQNEES